MSYIGIGPRHKISPIISQYPGKLQKKKLSRFSKIFHHNIPIDDFRDYVEIVLKIFHNPVIPQTVQKAKNIINTIAVSPAGAERGFSRMNIIYTDKRKCS